MLGEAIWPFSEDGKKKNNEKNISPNWMYWRHSRRQRKNWMENNQSELIRLKANENKMNRNETKRNDIKKDNHLDDVSIELCVWVWVSMHIDRNTLFYASRGQTHTFAPEEYHKWSVSLIFCLISSQFLQKNCRNRKIGLFTGFCLFHEVNLFLGIFCSNKKQG